jgi:formate dehydrogenase major subunit
MLAELLLKWPLIRQLKGGSDGTGADAVSASTDALRKKNDGAEVARSVCPQSPISRGHLCPKGAASYELVTHEARATKVKYRAPRSRQWSEMTLERAVDLVAQRIWDSRNRTFDEAQMHTTGIAHLGGATLDIEENYLIKKLFTAGLGMVCLSNQARI